MVSISIQYQGDLHCQAIHGPSHAELSTDAPIDNNGKGNSFSPTDLFPRYIRKEYVIRYSLKALPCLFAWLIITVQLLSSNFSSKSPHANQA